MTESENKRELQVLIVEDNASNFFLVSRLLEKNGFHCEWKTSGYSIVEFADTLPSIDLILLDIMLPYEDGFSAFRKIKQSPKLENVPIVAVTALANEEQMNKAKIAGFNGFIGKPLNPDRFVPSILKVLKGESVWDLNR